MSSAKFNAQLAEMQAQLDEARRGKEAAERLNAELLQRRARNAEDGDESDGVEVVEPLRLRVVLRSSVQTPSSATQFHLANTGSVLLVDMHALGDDVTFATVRAMAIGSAVLNAILAQLQGVSMLSNANVKFLRRNGQAFHGNHISYMLSEGGPYPVAFAAMNDRDLPARFLSVSLGDLLLLVDATAPALGTGRGFSAFGSSSAALAGGGGSSQASNLQRTQCRDCGSWSHTTGRSECLEKNTRRWENEQKQLRR